MSFPSTDANDNAAVSQSMEVLDYIHGTAHPSSADEKTSNSWSENDLLASVLSRTSALPTIKISSWKDAHVTRNVHVNCSSVRYYVAA